MKGWIYVASNESIPGSVKIGYSDRHPEVRIGELSGTSIPTPFKYAYGFLCDEPYKAERLIYEALRDCRVSAEREFFAIRAPDAIGRLREITCAHGIHMDLEEVNIEVDEENLTLGSTRRVAEKFLREVLDRLKEWKSAAERQKNIGLSESLIDFEVAFKNFSPALICEESLSRFCDAANMHQTIDREGREREVRKFLRQKCERDLPKFKRLMMAIDTSLAYLPSV